jgi:hypothetical protein
MINGNACFAYFNKIWGIPQFRLQTLNSTLIHSFTATDALCYRASDQVPTMAGP